MPPDLPAPPPSKAAFHLPGHPLPPIIDLPSTAGGTVDLFLLSLKRPVLVFAYPRTGAPGETVPASWDAIPSARGCTPELCGVRDSIAPLHKAAPSLAIFGLSTQTTEYQREAAERLRLPFPLLSDAEGKLQKALDLPTFAWNGARYLERITLLLRDGQITQVHHPIFPSTTAAAEALRMLQSGTPAA